MVRILLGKAEEVTPGHGKTFIVQGKRIIVANMKGTLVAYENFCPHMGGMVRYDGEKKMTCGWHGAQFQAATGENIAGADGQKLKPMTVVVDGENLYWEKSEEKSPWADDFS